MEKVILISQAFAKEANEQGIKNPEAFARCLKCHFIAVGTISEAMKKTTQVTFNYDMNTGQFELIDPFGLTGITNRAFTINYKE